MAHKSSHSSTKTTVPAHKMKGPVREVVKKMNPEQLKEFKTHKKMCG